MALSTKNLGATQTASNGNTKRDKVLNLMKHHSSLFDKEKVNTPKFIPRLAYHHKGQLVIGFYPKEIYGGKDIYIEFCDRNYVPEDPKRTLWKWKYNSDYEKDYELSDPHPSSGDRRFLVPVESLINVVAKHTQDIVNKIVPVYAKEPDPLPKTIDKPKAPEGEKGLTLDLDSGAGTDIPYSAMSLRDYAAIQWKRPVSQKKWLNELITKQFQI